MASTRKPAAVSARPAKVPATPGRKAKAKARSWQEPFLAALARSSNVTAAAKAAGTDTGTVYKARRADAAFNRRWAAALAEGYDNLEMDLLHRLRIGQLEGGKAQARRKYDNAIAYRLLLAHREAAQRQNAIRADRDEDAILAALDARLEAMRRRQVEKRLAARAARRAGNRADGAGDAGPE